MAEEKKPESSQKFDDFESKAKEALDEEADRVRVQQVLEDEELSEQEMEKLGHEEGAREHFTPAEEQE
jgi:hypothetical protein